MYKTRTDIWFRLPSQTFENNVVDNIYMKEIYKNMLEVVETLDEPFKSTVQLVHGLTNIDNMQRKNSTVLTRPGLTKEYPRRGAGMSTYEAAKIFGVSHTTIRNRLLYAEGEIKEKMKERGYAEIDWR